VIAEPILNALLHLFAMLAAGWTGPGAKPPARK
jgi:hypothetical protein